MSAPILRIVVTDANVLINLMHVSRLGLLAKIPNHEFVVPEHVREEISIPEQRTALDAAVSDGWLRLEGISDLGAITLFTELVANVGRGEAACIALAAKERWYIASDEKKRFRREAEARVGVGCILTTVDVFVLAIKAGLLTVEDADADKLMLETNRFKSKPTFTSYRELVKWLGQPSKSTSFQHLGRPGRRYASDRREPGEAARGRSGVRSARLLAPISTSPSASGTRAPSRRCRNGLSRSS